MEGPEQTPDGVLEVASLQDLLAYKLKVLLQRVETKDYLDIDALLTSGLDLARGLAGARALFPAFAPQECLKALTYFNDPPLKILSVQLQERLLKATGSVQAIPRAAVNDAVRFYEHFDFAPSPNDDRTLMILMKDVRAMLGA